MHITVNNLNFSYEGKNFKRVIFDRACVDFVPGKFYALMGPSGSGKTTLFRLLSKELETEAGTIAIGRRDLTDISMRELRSCLVGRIFQEYLLIPFLTPLENLLLAREIAVGKATSEDEQKAISLLDRVGLQANQGRPVESLSGGEQQRVAIARALQGSARILLSDEPTGALDEHNTAQIAHLLAELAHEQQMVVIAGTHDERVAECADQIVRIRDHKLLLE